MILSWVRKQFGKKVVNDYSKSQSVSENYELISKAELSQLPTSVLLAWLDTELPNRQRQLVDAQIGAYKNGQFIEPFTLFIQLLSRINDVTTEQKLLEIGCSSGYYSEVIQYSGLNIRYTGCDYSESFIKLAQNRYPNIDFFIADASNTKLHDRSFEIVVSGCCILHMINYEQAISEVARVSARWAIFHRTPVFLSEPTQFFTKNAYGVKTVEIHFNESELTQLFFKYGFEIEHIITLNQELDENGNIRKATKSYLLKKIG